MSTTRFPDAAMNSSRMPASTTRFCGVQAGVQRAEPILRKYKMPLAIENHKGWRSPELAEWVKATGSEYVGVCLDLVNNVSLIETPQQTINILAPYTIFVSFKDIGVDFYDQGLLLSEVPFGEGHLDLSAIVASCKRRIQRCFSNWR